MDVLIIWMQNFQVSRMWATWPDLPYLRVLGCALVMPHMKRTADAATLQATTWAVMTLLGVRKTSPADVSNSQLEDLLGKGVTFVPELQQESISNSFLLQLHASTAWGKLCATNCLLCLISFSCFWLFLVSVQPHGELGSCCNKSDWADRADQFLSQYLWTGTAKVRRVKGLVVLSLLFADDVVLLTSSSHDLQVAPAWFEAEYEVAGMRFSTSKSEAVALSWTKVVCSLQVSDELLLLEFCSKVKGKCNRWLMNRLV